MWARERRSVDLKALSYWVAEVEFDHLISKTEALGRHKTHTVLHCSAWDIDVQLRDKKWKTQPWRFGRRDRQVWKNGKCFSLNSQNYRQEAPVGSSAHSLRCLEKVLKRTWLSLWRRSCVTSSHHVHTCDLLSLVPETFISFPFVLHLLSCGSLVRMKVESLDTTISTEVECH